MLKIKHLILLLFLTGAQFLSAISLSDLDGMAAEDFPKSKTIRWTEEGTAGLTLLPEFDGADEIIERYNSFKPELAIQRIYRIDLPGRYSVGTSEGRRVLFTDLVNIFGNPETAVGYSYHSATREKDIVLFEENYISNKRGRRQDPFSYTPGTLESEISYYQYMDEANFSGTVIEQKISVGDNYLNYTSINLKTIWFTVIPVIGKGDTRNEILIFTRKGYLYIYNCTQVKEEPLVANIGLPIHLPSMFGKRMDIMVDWIGDQLSLAE